MLSAEYKRNKQLATKILKLKGENIDDWQNDQYKSLINANMDMILAALDDEPKKRKEPEPGRPKQFQSGQPQGQQPHNQPHQEVNQHD